MAVEVLRTVGVRKTTMADAGGGTPVPSSNNLWRPNRGTQMSNGLRVAVLGCKGGECLGGLESSASNASSKELMALLRRSMATATAMTQ